MSVDLSKIRFDGARIVRVIEDPGQNNLTFEVTYPIKHLGVDFEEGKLFFVSCSRYFVAERCFGEPTILRVEIAEETYDVVTIRMHTTGGVREVSCVCVGDGRTWSHAECVTEPGAAPNGGQQRREPVRSSRKNRHR